MRSLARPAAGIEGSRPPEWLRDLMRIGAALVRVQRAAALAERCVHVAGARRQALLDEIYALVCHAEGPGRVP